MYNNYCYQLYDPRSGWNNKKQTLKLVLGLTEGIKNLEKMIVKAKGYRMVIDWKMAYDEIKQITERIRQTKKKKKAKIATKGNSQTYLKQSG